MSLFCLMFRVSFSFQHSESHFHFGIQSRILSFSIRIHPLSLVRHSEPSCTFLFNIQSRIFILTFKAALSISASRAIIASQFRRSEPSSLLSYDVQNHPSQFDIQRCQFSVLAFRTILFLELDVQSKHCFSVTTFRVVLHSLAFIATISSQFGRSESSFIVSHLEPHFQFSVQSHNFFLQLGIQSHHFLQLDVQSHHPFSVWRSEPPSLFSLAFRATSPVWRSESLFSQFGIQSHVFNLAFRVASPAWCSKSVSLHSLVFRAIILS